MFCVSATRGVYLNSAMLEEASGQGTSNLKRGVKPLLDCFFTG